MTINEAVTNLSAYPEIVLIYFGATVISPLLLNLIYKQEKRQKFIELLYSIIIYAVAVPGILSASLLLYVMFLLKANILSLDALVYFVPTVSMAAVFFIISRKARFSDLPGFGRLSGLMLMLLAVYAVIFILYQLRFHIVFFGSFSHLLMLGAGLFVLFKIGMTRMKRNKNR